MALRSILMIASLLLATSAEHADTEKCRSEQSCLSARTPVKDAALLQLQIQGGLKPAKKHQEAATVDKECHTSMEGEPCFEGVTWAMQEGITGHPEWYPGLSSGSSFEEFQKVLHAGGHSDCPMPCEACHTARNGELCHAGVTWAMQTGINDHPEWYPGLNHRSSFEEFQKALHEGEHSECPLPCAAGQQPAAPPTAALPPAPANPTGPMPHLPGWHPTHDAVGNPAKSWCRVGVPEPSWMLKRCDGPGDLQVKVLSYNLFWWNLFGRRHGNGGSAGKLIRRNWEEAPYDFMAFQEADDVRRVLNDAGLARDYNYLAGSGMGWVYKKSEWHVLSKGLTAVTEDRPEQYYGFRNVQWGRARHKRTGRTVFFANHHGGLPLHTGGICGGEATAYKMLQVIAENAHDSDAIIFVGDFNAGVHTDEIKTLDRRIHRVFTGTAIGGIDHIYSNCEDSKVVSARKLGTGGSDHDAIEAVFKI